MPYKHKIYIQHVINQKKANENKQFHFMLSILPNVSKSDISRVGYPEYPVLVMKSTYRKSHIFLMVICGDTTTFE